MPHAHFGYWTLKFLIKWKRHKNLNQPNRRKVTNSLPLITQMHKKKDVNIVKTYSCQAFSKNMIKGNKWDYHHKGSKIYLYGQMSLYSLLLDWTVQFQKRTCSTKDSIWYFDKRRHALNISWDSMKTDHNWQRAVSYLEYFTISI